MTNLGLGPPNAPVSDEELAAQALAADPEVVPDPAGPSLAELLAPGSGGAGGAALLPTWYMPAPALGLTSARGWARGVALVIIVAFVAINAYGLCSTYGWVGFG